MDESSSGSNGFVQRRIKFGGSEIFMLHPKTNNKPHSFCTGSFLQEIQVTLPDPNIYSVLNTLLFAGPTPENI